MGQVLRKRAVDSLHLFTQVLVFSPISNLRLLQRMFLRRAIFFFFFGTGDNEAEIFRSCLFDNIIKL